MGAVTDKEKDAAQLAQVHAISADAREWIMHHLGNALAGAIGMFQIGRYDLAAEALDHAACDLRQIMPPADRARFAEINGMMREQRNKS